MSVLVKYAYSGKQVTREVFEAWGHWQAFHPEMRRRVWALLEHSGFVLGVGETVRDDARVLSEFLRRHVRVDYPTGIFYDGSYWARKPGELPSAIPGESYHLPCLEGFSVAADLIGYTKVKGWGASYVAPFGLRWFASDPPHVQPLEFPAARRDWNRNPVPLSTWKLPTPTPAPVPPPPPPTPEDEMKLTILAPRGSFARFLAWTNAAGVAIDCRWLRDNADRQRFVAVGAVEKVCEITDLAPLTLLGPLPTGDPGHQWSVSDFAVVTG